MKHVLFPKQTIDVNIIKVDHNKFAYKISKNMMHQPHECTRCICQAKRYV